MFLVVGLAVAGLAGIAAAFYFSIRSGNRRDKRLRSAGAGRAGTGRRPAGRSEAARPDLTAPPRRPASGDRPITTFRPAAVSSRNSRAKADTGPNPVLDFDQAPAGPDESWPADSWPDEPLAADPTATGPKLAVAGAAASPARPRRRVGFRKGADLDEELWPTETFGGVSDEQFWDALASDKPLTTTARTAQQDAPGKKRLPAGLPGTGQATGPAARPQGSGGYAAPRPGPDPAAERTAIQPAYAATQPVQSMKSQVPGATQPVRAAASTDQPRGAATQPTQPTQPAKPTKPTQATQPTQPAQPTQPTETRRRRPSSAEEDPLTSAAFSLRPSGPVDGRSSLRGRNASADRYDTAAPYPYPAPTYEDSPSAPQTMATPPYGQDYGYGRGDSAPQASEPRRYNGTGSHARPDDTGEGTRTTRQARPRHSYPGNGHQTGSYPVGGYPSNGYPSNGYPSNGYPSNGYPVGGNPSNGYPGNGHHGNGHRAPYDPRDDYRRLTHQH